MSVKISVDGKPVQLIDDAKLGENTVTVAIPEKDCTIAIVAQSESGASAPATVHLIRNVHVFKPSLYILAIGVSNYDNPELRLQFPAKDASDFTQTMMRQIGLLYERVDVKALTDKTATAANIRNGLYWLQTQTTNRDIAMLYIAGHGMNNNTGDFFFMPVDADAERISATGVSYVDIKTTVSSIAGKRLVFLDACHSGNVLGNPQQRAAVISQAASELAAADNGAVVFTSSTGRQYSLESTEWNNGAFTKALVEGLSGKADLSGKNTITVKSLEYYIANRVKELTNGKQAPTTIIPESIPDFPIALVPEDATAPENVASSRQPTSSAVAPTNVNAATPPAPATSSKIDVKTIQPRIMVIPFTKASEDIRTVLEDDVNKRIVLSKIKEAFDNRGYSTVDFTARLKQVTSNAVFSGDNKTDIKAQIIQNSGADVYVEAEMDISLSNSVGNKVKVILQAYEVSSSNSLSNKVGQSSSFADVGSIGAKAVENCIEDFLNTMQLKFSEIVENGRTIMLHIGFDQNSAYTMSSEAGHQGLFLQDEIELWMEQNAYKNYYHLQGASDTEMIFDDVRIPLKDPQTGNNYTVNRFGMSLFQFFRSLGLETKRDVKGNTLFITIQ